jgi:hypothetical protein
MEDHTLSNVRDCLFNIFTAAAHIGGLPPSATAVNADNTKYTIMSRDQNAGRSQNIRIDNIYFERVEDFKHLGTTTTNQNSVQEEIKS